MSEPTPDPRLDALLLEALARPPAEQDADPAEFDDAELAAWRAGELSADAAAELEGRLAESPEGRAVALGQADAPNDFHLLKAEKAAAAALGAANRGGRTRWLALAAAGLIAVGSWALLDGDAPRVGPADYATGQLEGGAAVVRSEAPAGTPVYYPSSTLVLKLRPAAARTAPTVHVLLSQDDGPLRAGTGWRHTATPEGALIIEAPAGTLFAEPGDYTVHVVLGPDTAPTTTDAIGDTWWQRYPVRFAPEPEAAP